MSWNVRHQGSPRAVQGLTLAQIIIGLRDGKWETEDEVMGPNDKTWVPIESHPQLEAVAAEMEPPEPVEHPDETKLDFNALIDVCLVLLILFILTATFSDRVYTQPISNAQPQGGPVGYKGGVPFKIQVFARKDQNGQTILRVEDGNWVSLETFPTVLRGWVKKTQKHDMILDAEGITWGTTVKINDAAVKAGINKVQYKVDKTKPKER